MLCQLSKYYISKLCFRAEGLLVFIFKMKTITLKETNSKMPLVGLGTWQAKPEEIEIAVNRALDLGCRLIDTAFSYNNEESIGNTLSVWLDQKKGERSDLFITTKLPHVANRAEDVEKFLRLSLSKLKLSYVDLYLIHMPIGFVNDEATNTPKVKENGDFELDMNTDHISLWKAMEGVKELGLTRNIGLSNFNEEQIEAIYQTAKVKPQVLQIECHVFLQQEKLRKYCEERHIAVTAYSPLGSPGAQQHFSNKYNYGLQNCLNLMDHPTVKEIAAKHQVTPSQVLLRFLVQQDAVVIPKSSNPERIKQNMDLFNFELSGEEVSSLKQLDRGEEARIIDFLFWRGAQNHPKYPFPIKG